MQGNDATTSPPLRVVLPALWRRAGFSSARELAARSGIARGTIDNVKTGKHKPDLDTLRVLAEALAIGPGDPPADLGAIFAQLAAAAGQMPPVPTADQNVQTSRTPATVAPSQTLHGSDVGVTFSASLPAGDKVDAVRAGFDAQLVERFGPSVGRALARLDRVFTVLRVSDVRALSSVVELYAERAERTEPAEHGRERFADVSARRDLDRADLATQS